MELKTFFVSLFSSLGGAIGISLAFLRFAKNRMETYIDNVIQHKFEKEIEAYKQKLNKQFSNYEIFSNTYHDCLAKVVSELCDVEKNFKVTQNGIKKCLDEGLTLEYFFHQNDNMSSIIKLHNIVGEFDRVIVSCRICFEANMTEEVEGLYSKISEYMISLNQEIETTQLDRSKCNHLLNLGTTIHSKVKLLSNCIRDEILRKSGEL